MWCVRVVQVATHRRRVADHRRRWILGGITAHNASTAWLARGCTGTPAGGADGTAAFSLGGAGRLHCPTTGVACAAARVRGRTRRVGGIACATTCNPAGSACCVDRGGTCAFRDNCCQGLGCVSSKCAVCRGGGQACGRDDECCRGTQCSNQQCCAYHGGACGDSVPCCQGDGLSCESGICCYSAPRSSCSVTADCCLGLVCQNGECMLPHGSVCSFIVDCVDGDFCGDGRCCSGTGTSCSTAGDCCSGACTGGKCACVPSGGTCNDGSNCCIDSQSCIDSKCR
jgi:hypothetical protein